MSKKTETRVSEYKGNPTLAIVPVVEEGEPTGYPVITFGISKAKAILRHVKEIEAFVVNNDKKAKDA